MSSMYRPSGPEQAGRRPCFSKLGYVDGRELVKGFEVFTGFGVRVGKGLVGSNCSMGLVGLRSCM